MSYTPLSLVIARTGTEMYAEIDEENKKSLRFHQQKREHCMLYSQLCFRMDYFNIKGNDPYTSMYTYKQI